MTALPTGLAVIRLADDVQPTNPRRWRIRHEAAGSDIAEALRHEDAIAGAAWLAQIADWTQDAEHLRNTSHMDDLYVRLGPLHCLRPGSEHLDQTVSRNGEPSEDDYLDTAAYFRAEGYNALDILLAMTNTVPWNGLDIADFNAAHDRICALANAA